jgi:hypothetical protein
MSTLSSDGSVALGAVVIAAWLVEAKQSVIENMAPVLTLVSTPLFTLVLLGFLATMAWTGRGVSVEPEVLIGFDALQLLLVTSVLLVDDMGRTSPSTRCGRGWWSWSSRRCSGSGRSVSSQRTAAG